MMTMSPSLHTKQAEQVSLQVSPQAALRAILDEMRSRLGRAETYQALAWIDVTGFKNGGNPVAPRSRDEFLSDLLGRMQLVNDLIASVQHAARVLEERIEE